MSDLTDSRLILGSDPLSRFTTVYQDTGLG